MLKNSTQVLSWHNFDELAYFGACVVALMRAYSLNALGACAVSTDSSNAASAIHRVKEELYRLAHRQADALESATYLGMTSDDAKEHDKRRTQITELVQALALLEKAR